MDNHSHLINFKKNERIFKAGEVADCAFIIESGKVGLYALTQSDKRVAVLGQGEMLGEMGVIDETNRSISAFAETDLELMVVDRNQITKRLENTDPIIRSVMEVLLRRIRSMLSDDVIYSVDYNKTSKKKSSNNTSNLIVSEGIDKIRFEKELHQALDNDEIINVYQPMVDLKHGYIAGFEALSRWKHPKKGMISPFQFITLAEESDLIVTMGNKIFDNACKQLAIFQKIRDESKDELPEFFMSINVSAAQLTAHNFLLDIKGITNKYNINPENIKIEITESLVVDYEKVKVWIDDCHKIGFKLSLDDFGTGYSGFQHLLELDFHTIKIDQAFTMTIDTNPKSVIMLEVIADLAKRLNMSIVAEGIEDLECANKLTSIGVDYGQGYYFYKPMMPEDLLSIIR